MKKRSFVSHPIGHVRTHRKGILYRKNYIKVASDANGRRSKWISFARHLWEQHHGPVPPGKIVYHINGDELDDRIENLAVGTKIECRKNWERNNPEQAKAMHTVWSRAMAKRNRAKTIGRHVLGLTPGRYYPVDREKRVILNTPFHCRTKLYASVGIEPETIRATVSGNSQGLIGAVLGWPGMGGTEACLLAVMLGRDWTRWRDVWPDFERFAKDRVGCFPSTWRGKLRLFSNLTRKGLLERRMSGPVAEWRPTPQATLTRGVWTNYVALPGKEAARLGYRRIDPKFGDVTVPNETVMSRVIRTVKAEARANKATP